MMIFVTLQPIAPTIPVQANNRFGWYPDTNDTGVTQNQQEQTLTLDWLKDHLPPETHDHWVRVLTRSGTISPSGLLTTRISWT